MKTFHHVFPQKCFLFLDPEKHTHLPFVLFFVLFNSTPSLFFPIFVSFHYFFQLLLNPIQDNVFCQPHPCSLARRPSPPHQQRQQRQHLSPQKHGTTFYATTKL